MTLDPKPQTLNPKNFINSRLPPAADPKLRIHESLESRVVGVQGLGVRVQGLGFRGLGV